MHAILKVAKAGKSSKIRLWFMDLKCATSSQNKKKTSTRWSITWENRCRQHSTNVLIANNFAMFSLLEYELVALRMKARKMAILNQFRIWIVYTLHISEQFMSSDLGFFDSPGGKPYFFTLLFSTHTIYWYHSQLVMLLPFSSRFAQLHGCSICKWFNSYLSICCLLLFNIENKFEWEWKQTCVLWREKKQKKKNQ